MKEEQINDRDQEIQEAIETQEFLNNNLFNLYFNYHAETSENN